MQNLIETFRRIGNLTTDNEKVLLDAIERKQYPSKTLLQDQDKTSNKIYFVEKGIARTYYYKDGKDITHWIAIENDFVGSMSSFFMRKPSNKIVETIEECTLWEFEYQKLENLCALHPEFDKIVRLFAYYGLSLLEERFDNLHFNTANQNRINKNTEIYYLNQLNRDLLADSLFLHQEKLNFQNSLPILQKFLSELHKDNNRESFNNAISAYINDVMHPISFVSNNASFNEMKSSAKLGIIGDNDLRNRIVTLYNHLEDTKSIYVTNYEFMNAIDVVLISEHGLAKYQKKQSALFAAYNSDDDLYALKGIKDELESNTANWN